MNHLGDPGRGMDIGSPFRRVVIDTAVTQGGMSLGNPRRLVVGIRSLCDGLRHRHSQSKPAGCSSQLYLKHKPWQCFM